jgi:hypothetical protein
MSLTSDAAHRNYLPEFGYVPSCWRLAVPLGFGAVTVSMSLAELALLTLLVLLSMFAQHMSRCTSRGEICGHSRICHSIRKFNPGRTSEQQAWSYAVADLGELEKYSEIRLDFLPT